MWMRGGGRVSLKWVNFFSAVLGGVDGDEKARIGGCEIMEYDL